MKKLIYIFIFLGIFISCEDVVEIDLNESEPRLVIEANLDLLENGQSITKVRLTLSAPFYEDEVPIVSDATIIIKEDDIIHTLEYAQDGYYIGNFDFNYNIDYTLEVLYNNELYTATQQLISVTSIDYVEQVNDAGSSGDEIDLKIFFTDPPNEENYYFYEGTSGKGLVVDSFSDEFFDGNQIFALYSVDDLEAGDNVQIRLYGVDEQFYNFMSLLLQQNSSGGGPFETQPATVRGNIVNLDKPDNFPFGYFRVSNVYRESYTIE
ncbi:MAG: DUF4249 domain-containing protein [Flavobacteriaceae bacterium]|nr:DUF4249 domain-containing protein [Flavobacteriaceae bacterium]